MSEHNDSDPALRTTWIDDAGRMNFSMSGPTPSQQAALVERVVRSMGVNGYFDALCGWWRSESNRPVDIPLLPAIVCAYGHGRADAEKATRPAQTAIDLPRALRSECKHDSYSVEGCLHCLAADAIERLHAMDSETADVVMQAAEQQTADLISALDCFKEVVSRLMAAIARHQDGSQT